MHVGQRVSSEMMAYPARWSARTWGPFLVVLGLLPLLTSGCSKGPAIEGYVFYFESDVPAAGVQVLAITQSDIKEQQSRTHLQATTDSNGRFVITGFIQNSTYEFSISDDRFWEPEKTDIESRPPEEGTRLLKESLRVLPRIASGDLYAYDPSTAKVEAVDLAGARTATVSTANTPAALDERCLETVELQMLSGDVVDACRIKIPDNVYLMLPANTELKRLVPLEYFEGPLSRSVTPRTEIDIAAGWYLGIYKMSAWPSSKGWRDMGHQPMRNEKREWPAYLWPFYFDEHDARSTPGGRFDYQLSTGKAYHSRGVYGDGGKGWAIKPRPGVYLLHRGWGLPSGYVIDICRS